MSWWNPTSWWNDATHTASGVVSAVENWVKHVVKSAVDLVENDIFDTIQFAATLFGWAETAITKAAGEAYGWVVRAIAYAEHLTNTLRHDITSWVTTLVRDLGAAITATVHLAEHLHNSVVAWAGHELGRLGALIHSGLNNLLHWAEHAISTAVGDLYRLLLRDFIAPILAVVRVVKKAWDWVIWFAEHPFQFFHDAETDSINLVRHLPDEVFTAVKGKEFADQVDEVAKWFGF